MWKLALSFVSTIALIFILGVPISSGDFSIPPLGKFFHPAIGFWQNAEPVRQKAHNQTVFIKGLNEEIEVLYDDRDVPHIFASSEADAYFVQGYITASERLWQMDITTRAAAGRIAEILGNSALEFDKKQRRHGMTFAAENAIEGWKAYPEMYALLEAYSKGVNAYVSKLKKKNLPLEFKLLNYVPEPWSPYKTALFSKSMAQRLCSSENDLENTYLIKMLGDSLFHTLFPEWNPKQAPVIPSGTPWRFTPVSVTDSIKVTEIPDLGFGSPIDAGRDDILYGSNNWALSGNKTESGNPILCNDPHLGLTLPSVWYEIQISTPEYICHGVSLPGTPGIVIGFNSDVAWGVTNAGHDVMDWYQIEWANANQTAYFLDGQEKEVDFRIEEIQTKSGDLVIDTVKYTVWGPVFDEGPYAGLALRWLAHDTPHITEIKAFWDLNKAKNTTDIIHALEQFITPAQNFVFGDRFGNIGLRVSGHLPLKRPLQGRFVQQGSRSSNQWQGFVPQRHNPLVVNPEHGFVASANQQSTDTTYPYYYNGSPYFEDYRSRIIHQKLAELEDASIDDIKQLQNDNFSLKASEILPLLLGAIDSDSLSKEKKDIYDILKSWDYTYDPADLAPVYFEIFYKKFYRQTWDEFLSLPDTVPSSSPESWMTIQLAENTPGHPYFDIDSTDGIEQFADVALVAFQAMCEQVDDPEKEYDNWGSYQSTTINHIANIDALSRPLKNAPGHGDAINATTSTTGPSWRMIVELGNIPKAWVVYPGGQTGNPGSVRYDSMIENWVSGEYFEVNLFQDKELMTLEENISETLVFKSK